MERAINARVLLIRDNGNVLYLDEVDGWITSSEFRAGWTVDSKPSSALSDAKAEALIGGNIDLSQGVSKDGGDHISGMSRVGGFRRAAISSSFY